MRQTHFNCPLESTQKLSHICTALDRGSRNIGYYPYQCARDKLHGLASCLTADEFWEATTNYGSKCLPAMLDFQRMSAWNISPATSVQIQSCEATTKYQPHCLPAMLEFWGLWLQFSLRLGLDDGAFSDIISCFYILTKHLNLQVEIQFRTTKNECFKWYGLEHLLNCLEQRIYTAGWVGHMQRVGKVVALSSPGSLCQDCFMT